MNNKRDGIPFNGFNSVIEMLRHADAGFRDKLLNNVRRRDPHLARRLEAELRQWLAGDDSRDTLERSQRSAHTRNYGH
ncbi:MAG TPA: hypothetical protein VIH99_13640 [Bdellovibrionota bacterium]|jgi:hypothetical protein